MKKLRKFFAVLLAVCMTMSLLSVSVGAAVKGNSYWNVQNQQESILLTEHTVLDSTKNPVAIGAEPGSAEGLLTGLDAGEMAARKFGAFENETDAANGIVKLTFDVVGQPLDVPGPLDVVIIADESGSLNMYGRTNTSAYMPCLNANHVYLADGLQIELYQIAKLRADVAVQEATATAETTARAAAEAKTVADNAVKAAEEAAAAAEADLENEELQVAADVAASVAEGAIAAAETAENNAGSAAAALKNAVDLQKDLEEKLEALTTVPGQTIEQDAEQAPDGENNDGGETPATPEPVDTRAFICPASANLQYVTFGQWSNYPTQVRAAVKNAGVEIPENLTDADVSYALFNDGTELYLNKGVATYRGRTDWDPDNKHCYSVDGEYVTIPEPSNEAKVQETNRLYSYYSPAADNPYGCYDRMMVEKDSIAQLANKIVSAHEQNRVAYVGFFGVAYPSLSSYYLGEGGFCGKDHISGLLDVIGNTNGHDYTNYVHAMYLARKMVAERADTRRPCYVVFISDGLPNQYDGYSSQLTVEEGGWSVLDIDKGDYPWYDDVYHASSNSQIATAKMAAYFREFLGETNFYTVGFSTNDDASNLLQAMASSSDQFFNCATAEEFMDDMEIVKQDIMTQYPDGAVTDKIGEHFDLLIDSAHPFTMDGTEYIAESALPDTVTISRETMGDAGEGDAVEAPVEQNAGTTAVSWNLTDVDEEGVRVSFYVKLKSEYMEKDLENVRIHQTNADTAEKAGAELTYHQLFLDETYTLPEGYYAAEDITVKELLTPYVQLKNGEITAVKSSNKLDQPVAVGETITYTVTLKNQGLLDMDETIVVSDTIPEGTEYVENSASDGGVFESGKVTWTIAGLAAGEEKTVSFTVAVTEEAENEIVNIAYFGADDPATDTPDTPEIPTNEVKNPLKDGEPEVYGTLTIDKRFSGATLAEFKDGDRFEFVLKNNSGASMGTVVLEVETEINEADGTTTNTLVQISNPLELIPGNYTIEETFHADLAGKTFAGVSVANDGAVIMESANVAVVVTNIYTTNSTPGGNGGGSDPEPNPDPTPGSNPGVNIEDEDPPLTEMPEEDVPLASLPDEEPPLAMLPDEEVPLALLPATGDASALWMALSALSGAGLFVTRKKRDEE